MSIDRERFYYLYLLNYFKQSAPKNHRILDFAPSHMFSEKLRKTPSVLYTSADLFRTDMDLQIDLCDMRQVPLASYDVVICSHILEHVDKPDRALSEIFRIMKYDAIAIIMVPLFWDVKETVEEAGADSEELRYKFYGQADHVRLFSKSDFIARLHNAGFLVSQVTPNKLDNKMVRENAISENSILYVCSKIN
ncbi:MAG: methyltransferase domain-containing protein [Chryseolinea sp.]